MKPNSLLSGVLLIASIFAVTEVGLFVRDARNSQEKLVGSIQATIAEIHETAKTVNAYTAEQAKVFNSRENRQMQQALRDAAATTIKILRKVNQKTIPEFNAAIGQAGLTLTEARAATASLNLLIQHSDESINKALVPEIVATAQALNVNLEALGWAIKEITATGVLTLKDIHGIMADPSWRDALQSITASSKHVEGMTASADEAMKQAPSIAQSLEKIAKTSSKWQKSILLSQIISILIRAF